MNRLNGKMLALIKFPVLKSFLKYYVWLEGTRPLSDESDDITTTTSGKT